ncbi:NADH oxidase [Lindgomyces ingoldianus]|uniref:NADH oxidase n=1 Tax=Lindgomyces ingoldianus TaxID=673940 RepID=A0ACB6QDH6_9PLEO|nr:NADH oxidase [Lindgomyces ingoldianus]KAF2465034.1 NADH oxidase [Lindgomyces ingoldianus]
MTPKRFEAKMVDPSPLGQPLHFSFANRSAPNRFLKGAMTERLSSWHPTDLPARGIPSKEVINVYRRWGEGGLGTMLTGNIQIELDQLEAAGNLIIPRTEPPSGPRFEAFAELAEVAKREGSLIVAQVSHPGRQCQNTIQKDPVSASDVKLEGNLFGMEFNKPHAATQNEINIIVEGFAHAAEYLEKAGFDGIELHGAHGYLIAQFLSETTNLRTDSYGGTIPNRARIIVEIAAAIRSRVSPSFILGIKLNSVEFQARGFQPSDAREICKILEENRFDFVELSGGTYEQLGFVHKRESTKKREAFFIEFADMIVPVLKETKAYVTGGFHTASAMVDALKTVDGVGLARPVCQEPRLCKDILSGKVNSVIQKVFDENDFMIQNLVAGTQIKLIGMGYEPFDASDPKVAEAFQKDVEKWMEAMGKDEKGEKYGFVDIESIPAVPYGTAIRAA